MSGPVRVTGYIRCAPDEVEILRAALADHVRLSRAEPGCLSFEAAQDPEDPCRWTFDETFRDRAAFEAHRERARASEWPRITGHMHRDIHVDG